MSLKFHPDDFIYDSCDVAHLIAQRKFDEWLSEKRRAIEEIVKPCTHEPRAWGDANDAQCLHCAVKMRPSSGWQVVNGKA